MDNELIHVSVRNPGSAESHDRLFVYQLIPGFTLIEVLVVVAIIALLISILLPSMSGVRHQSKKLVCATNLHTWSSAAMLYAQSNQDFIPRDYGWSPSYDFPYPHVCAPEVLSQYLGGPKWPLIPLKEDPMRLSNTVADRRRRDELLAPIFARMEMLQCPAFPKTGLAPLVINGEIVDEQPLDYAINAFDFSRSIAVGGGGVGQGITKMSVISKPGQLIYVTEVNRENALDCFGFHDVYKPKQTWWGAVPRMINDNRHPGFYSRTVQSGTSTTKLASSNALYFDGHAVTMPIDQMTISLFTPYLDPTDPNNRPIY
ncbi:MAG: prepilin-type N-terminal cleavage/methylation domain-containing protein [Planctomycetota bacterium]|nr:MAG: prepilin-type N-terminal cleavage/methylation domain-containing protein [Planctomycetota bacterium]